MAPEAEEQGAGTTPAAAAPQRPKKPRHEFRPTAHNLPDGPWKRKLLNEKRELIQKSKTRREYAKVKKRLTSSAQRADGNPPGSGVGAGAGDDQQQQQQHMHPARQAMLTTDDGPATGSGSGGAEASVSLPSSAAARPAKPRGAAIGGGDPLLRRAAAVRAEREAARAAARARGEERDRKVVERGRVRRAVARAKGVLPGGGGSGGGVDRGGKGKVAAGMKGGGKKLGRESTLLLEKVKRLVGKS